MKNLILFLILTASVLGQSNFITIDNGKFYDGNIPYRFVGFNAYYLQQNAAAGKYYIVDDVFTAADSFHVKVIRTWAFNDDDPAADSGAIRLSPYEFNEKGLIALDYVLFKAGVHNKRVILTLANNHADYGGIAKYIEWGAEFANKKHLSHSDFFTDDTLKQWYKYYAETILNRVNTYTGKAYKDDPAIFAIELINEASNPQKSPDIITGWYDEMSRYVKSIDYNHLVATGEEGYDANLSDYSNTKLCYNGEDYLFNGYKGTGYYANSSMEGIDYCSFHMYPELAGFSMQAGKTWIDDHYNIAWKIMKPALCGEVGIKEKKEEWFKYYFEEFKKSSQPGCMLWQYMHKDIMRNNDGFGFNEKDFPDLMAEIKEYALSIENDTAGVLQPAANVSPVLYQNYPNPFTKVTTIRYLVPKDGHVKLTLYSITGQVIGVLEDTDKKKGEYEKVISIKSSALASGVYVCRLMVGGSVTALKIVLQK